MLPGQFQIALEKATDADRPALLALEPLVLRAHELNATLTQRIQASKARRTGKPERLSKRRQEELDGYDEDARRIDTELTQSLRGMGSREILGVFEPGLAQDLSFWEQNLKHAHADERVILEETLEARRQLLARLRECLRGKT